MKPTTSPLIEDYRQLREKIGEDTLLLVSVGDFWEAFDDCAERLAKLCNLTLTKRRGVLNCGVPYHMVERTIKELTAAGVDVAVSMYPPPGKGRKIDETHVAELTL